MRRFLAYIAVLLYFGLLVVHVFLLVNGASGYITGLLILPAVFGLIDALLKRIRPTWRESGWRISYWSVLVALLLLESVLRFGVRKHLAYAESNGNLYYSSPFLQHRIEGIIERLTSGSADVRLKTGPKSQKVVDSKPEFTYAYTYNSMGFRDREYPNGSLTGKRVILCLGDSFCEGVGAPPDLSWPHQLEQLLAQTDSSVVVINAGIQGSDVFFELYKLEQLLYGAYRPQTVILSVNSTDVHDILIRRGKERFAGRSRLNYRQPPWWEYLYGFSMVTRYVVHDVFGVGPELIPQKQLAAWNREARDALCDALAEDFAGFARENRLQPLVVFHPMFYEISGKDDPFAECRARLDDVGLGYLDLYRAFREVPDTALRDIHWPIDLHYNEKGYHLMAELIGAQLKKPVDSLP